MPELPEVECLSQAIKPLVEGCTLTKAVFHRKDIRFPIPIPVFKRTLVGQEITQVFRRSKYILMQTQRGYAVFHLGMTGNILSGQSMKSSIKHTHASFCFEHSNRPALYLHFIDPRRFGIITCIEGEVYDNDPLFAHLGPEPLQQRRLDHYLLSKKLMFCMKLVSLP